MTGDRTPLTPAEMADLVVAETVNLSDLHRGIAILAIQQVCAGTSRAKLVALTVPPGEARRAVARALAKAMRLLADRSEVELETLIARGVL